MIKHTELRIGNYVLDNLGGLLKIKGVNTESDLSHIKPIPLSEEWLIRAGFGESHNGWYKSPIASAFDYIGEKTTGIWVVMDMESPEIKWVHQLQNLVFALTGEELTFKDIDK